MNTLENVPNPQPNVDLTVDADSSQDTIIYNSDSNELDDSFEIPLMASLDKLNDKLVCSDKSGIYITKIKREAFLGWVKKRLKEYLTLDTFVCFVENWLFASFYVNEFVHG